MSATIWPFVAEHLGAFVIGVGCGFLLSNRFKLVRRNGE